MASESNPLDIRIDIARAKAAAVGSEHGVTPAEYAEIEPRVLEIHRILEQERRDGKYGFYDLYKDTDALEAVKAAATKFAAFEYENLVVLGIGGSALGITALNTALNPPFYNMMTKAARKRRPRLFVMDNIDPLTFKQMMRMCPPKKSLYVSISKSGGTAETTSQTMIVLDALEQKLGKDGVKDHLVVITSPRVPGAPKSLLHPVADEYGLTSLDIPLNVGGRFSVFTPVGLFPAALLGMDLDAIMAGCAAMDARTSAASLHDNPAYLRAATQYLLDTRKGKVMSVMMPYADALRDVADWYRQLWAESLGKRLSLDGAEVFTGQTPVKALGATDQHSQVQLYAEGPNDKVFNVIEAASFGSTLKIPANLTSISELEYLRGKSMNKLMSAELRGTIDALKDASRPVIKISLPRVNAHTVSQLLYMLEVETAMAGRLYNVDAFNQPGVEAGKIIARKLMGA
ncbi:MAG: glucose-6-phosphate isomerase [Candidatus Hydrogenedens sp.]|nr:glucose-6-phosphate isomerase [Candidatus Hydrogenedens sp.]